MTGFRVCSSLVLVVLAGLPILACGGEDIVPSDGPPRISLTTSCLTGRTTVILKNTGGAMSKALLFEAVFADGERDTLYLKAGAGATVACPLSNIHGAATITNQKYGISAKADDCLTGTLSMLLANYDLATLIPSPLGSQDITVCTYTVDIRNFQYDQPTFELRRKEGRLVLKYVFRNLRGDVNATGNSWACPDIDGDFRVAAIVSETEIIIDEGGTPEVALGTTETSVQGLDVKVAGNLGFVADWIIELFEDNLTDEMSRAIEAELNALAGSDLGNLVVVASGCGIPPSN